MRLSSLLGIIGAVSVIFYANHDEGDPVAALLKMSAAMIVFGGTFMSVLIQSEFKGVLGALKSLKWLVRPPEQDPQELIRRFEEWTREARRRGMLALEQTVKDLQDPFLREGLQMVIDGVELEPLRRTLEAKMETDNQADERPAQIWEAAGGYAPTIGVLGAVIGLIHVMLNLSNPSSLGNGIATAFVATVYGVGSANLAFLPVGKRLKDIAEERARFREMVVEATLLLAEGANAQTIRTQLQSFIVEQKKAGEEGEEQDEKAA